MPSQHQHIEQFYSIKDEYTSPLEWDEWFMRMVYLTSEKSKDPSTKIGSILVRDNRPLSNGYNGFPIGVRDYKKRYDDRHIKLKFVVHSELNAILSAGKNGESTLNTILYTQSHPCNECAKSIINSGIREIIIHGQYPEMSGPTWKESVNISKIMLTEANIKVRIFNKLLGIEGFFNGERIKV
jgi:dCMP deaminase